ncbi:indolepyruvate ferredoxin oxidoreductase family protein [Maribius pontilimi]|uniref:Indolepyruvate ferredoxin oxidoreductase family protein n=1 Tax=Palleronia pontilimi TaxID=1964209 RepID=A0A934IFE7_9RHOB|nr:indolepyruvate ferredoxin oxidoreductase family protein [Palleronia pontilimi]MBJ3761878.1 indolepyruvate ferredoxin oxidoreductase family protein [Palleronia pontilimi]
MRHDVSLQDKYDLSKHHVLLNGTQALVRLMLMQKARDRAAGHDTAGYVTGYRGSPLGAVDLQMAKAGKLLTASDIVFQPGLNEDLAATALWGTQQAGLRGDGKHDGVFGLWYGKGPGVDRSGDVMRHANMAGTAPLGGVIMAMGDDHTGESSTTCHQSDWAMVDAYMPVLSPAGVQEILDFGLYGFALSRFAGVWAGLKLMKDTVEVTSVVDGRPDRMSFVTPDFALPPDGLHIRLADHWVAQEARMVNYKRHAAEAFSRANRMDRRVWGKPGASIGLVAAGKNWLDLQHALGLLGLDAGACERLGITTYKVGQTWPLDMDGFHDWAEGLDLVIVVEEKRKLIEVQIKEALFDDRKGRRVYGWHKGDTWEHGRRLVLFPVAMALDPVQIAEKLGDIFIEEGRDSDHMRGALGRVRDARRADNAPEIASRLPYFCAGCPHNTSTKVPEGSRAYAGIGCHFMVQWMDRDTQGFTHMGAEGANWIGEAPFSKTHHVFQNLGDGTYNHSGLMAIRAALAAKTNITYKILYNDAVAMTGGQPNDGDLHPDRIAREIQAAGVKHIAVVYDPKEEPVRDGYPKGLTWYERDDMPAVMERMRAVEGVSAIIYIQTCAAEKRRRRKRGTFPDPDTRVFINTDVCEGCGDCGVQSNCVAIVPVETELGRKRAIDQSSCNKDYSCLKGFCPSFVTVEGGEIRKEATAEIDVGHLPDPELPKIDGTHNVVITGVGGTGVVTIGAVLAMAAHLDGKGAGMMEMAGLAQKGGAVHIHCRLAERPEDISAIRVASGECDALVGGDLVTSAGAKTLGLMRTGRTGGVVNSHEIMTGDFTRDTAFRIPADELSIALERRLGDDLQLFDASELARVLMGDTIFSNMIVFGAVWQRGLIPVAHDAILAAIEMNGAAVARNQRAFELGRWAAVNPDGVARVLHPTVVAKPKSLDERIAFRAEHLRAFQGKRLAKRYLKRLEGITDLEVKAAVAEGYHKLLSYKDEYEVARLLRATRAQVAETFNSAPKLTYHLAAPLVAKTGADGRPGKRAFGPWIERLFPLLARMKMLRGTPLDPFGRTAERRLERALIAQYEADIDAALPKVGSARDAVIALARLPLDIRGFGPVKQANADAAALRREDLLAAIDGGDAGMRQAAE